MDNGVWVRASIHLAGMRPGQVEYVNPDDPYVAECLEGGYLQRLATRGDVSDEEPVAGGDGATAEPDPVVEAAPNG
jgi:hypothetical protein